MAGHWLGKWPLGGRMVPNTGCMAVYAMLWNDPGQDPLMSPTIMPHVFLGEDSVHLNCLLR